MYICTYFCMSVQNKTCRALNACSCLLHHTDSGNAFMNKQEIFYKGREIFLPFSLTGTYLFHSASSEHLCIFVTLPICILPPITFSVHLIHLSDVLRLHYASYCLLLFYPYRGAIEMLWQRFGHGRSEGILLCPLCAPTSSCNRPPNSKFSNLIISNLGTVKDERIQSKNKLRFKYCFQLLHIYFTKTLTLLFRD